MKKIFVLFILFLTLLIPTKDTLAYEQTEAVCYSQCAAHKFVWKGDFCWDLFQSQCARSQKSVTDDTIDMIKDAAKSMASGKRKMIVDVEPVFTAMFVCKPLIDDCIAPILAECKRTCTTISQTYYAPNLSVGSPYGATMYQNVFYSEERHELWFKVTNNGGYAWDIDVTASWGHTPNRDKLVSGGGMLFDEKIPEMVFFGARVGSPKSPGDYVSDFLINETNFSNFLSKYKSDADNHYIPPAWYKTIPFTAPEGEYTKVILNVDPNQNIPESGETDNTYILEIDKLPTPVSFEIENLKFQRTNPTSLTDYKVNFDLKNNGEEGGKANIKWYEGDYESGKNPVYEQATTIQGLGQASFDHTLSVDVTNGGDSCNSTSKYTLVVFDDDGLIKTRQEFSLPKYAGSIYGQVDDLFGKKVVGATVSLNTGQTTVTDDAGFFHIGGIATLGKLTIKVTHPDFSQTEEKEVELSFDDSQDKCHIEGLTHTGINFVMKDQSTVFTVTLKDPAGNLINGHVLATNKISDDKETSDSFFRLDKDINGTGELGALQPGEYMFTIFAGGYKTIGQTVSAVPNNQNLEFILEPLLGRKDEGPLTIQNPQLLWQMDRGTEILSRVVATKDGKRVMIYTSNNKTDSGKLYFLDSISGQQIKSVDIPGAIDNSRACLSTSYDGNTTALLVHNSESGSSKKTINALMLFDSQGNEFARDNNLSSGGISNCAVSYDGFYIYPGFLINKSLYAYTRMEIEGIGGYKHKNYSSLGPLYFLHGNGLIAGCKDGGECAMSIAEKEITNYGNVKGPIRVVDSGYNDSRVIFGGYDKLFVYGREGKAFEKEVNASGSEPSASISMGSGYIIYSHNEPDVHNSDFKIINSSNAEMTPSYEKDKNENVIFVHANDKGLFYLAEKGKTLKYYQVGNYTDEYNPPNQTTPIPSLTTTGLSLYIRGNFQSTGEISFDALTPGYMYRADKTLKLKLNVSGSVLTILEGTLFSLDGGRHPILLKGQLTTNFKEPTTIYAIKFDRYDLELFQTKLDQFWRIRTLPENEYFVIKNIHTRYKVTNLPNQIEVAVENGQVNVKGDKIDTTINSGKKISIDASNSIKESIYISLTIYAIIVGALILILSVILFFYRKTKIGGKIIELLKIIGKLIWRIIKFILFWLWKIIKILFQSLRNLIKKNNKLN